jgi:hypothetical protein
MDSLAEGELSKIKAQRYADAARMIGYTRAPEMQPTFYGETPVVLRTQVVGSLIEFSVLSIQAELDRDFGGQERLDGIQSLLSIP